MALVTWARASGASRKRAPASSSATRNAGKVLQARAHVAEAGLSDLVEIREGDALQTLARDLPESIDLVLLDGAKVLYPRILALLEPRLSPGAIVVADNADDSPEYVAHVRNPAHGYTSVPFAEDVELSMRVRA